MSITYLEAIREAQAQALRDDSRVFIYGQDIGVFGGAFKATGATNGVTVFDKTGKPIEHIDVPEKWSANVSFGGRDHQTLFITASQSLYSIRLGVKGANPAK